MLYLHYVSDEFVEAIFHQLRSVSGLEDNPINQTIVNNYFRRFNGPLCTLDEPIAEIANCLIAKTEMAYMITGIFSLVEKGNSVMYNGVLLTLPKIMVCEDNG